MGVTLANKLPDIAKELRPKVSRAVKKAAQLVADQAKENAPHGASGELAGSIKVENAGSGLYRVIADANSGNGEWVNFYAQWVEFGTTDTAAQPFLIPALESKRKEAEDLVAEVLRDLP